MASELKLDPGMLLHVVDSVPETRGMGVVLIANNRGRNLRQSDAASSSIVFQLRDAGKPGSSTPSYSSSRDPLSNPHFWAELWGMGVSCGGAVISGVGAVGTTALAPETGGLSLPAAALLWGGATASAAQCGVSFYRFGNVLGGRDQLNDALDQDTKYRTAMYILDGVGLVGAGGAIKEIAATRDALQEAGVAWQAAEAGDVSRAQRRVLTEALELQGAKRASGALISRFVKLKLLDLTGAVLGVGGSATTDGGSLHDVVIWVVSKPTSSGR